MSRGDVWITLKRGNKVDFAGGLDLSGNGNRRDQVGETLRMVVLCLWEWPMIGLSCDPYQEWRLCLCSQELEPASPGT